MVEAHHCLEVEIEETTMLIHCPQPKVKDVMLRSKLTSASYGMVLSDVLKVTFQGGETDPFQAYYEATRTSDEAFQEAPHYQFANIMGFEDVALFLKRFGFPAHQGGRDIILGEFLIQAKRLHQAMKAWASVTQGAWSDARESLAELGFALHSDAHWYFWPAPIYSEITEAHEFMRLKEQFMQSMEQQRPNPSLIVGSDEWESEMIRRWKAFGLSDSNATAIVARARQEHLKVKELSPSDVFAECVRQIQSLCVEPLRWVEITPDLRTVNPKSRAQQRRLELCWNLNPIEFLGEEEDRGHTLTHEEPHFETPYFLMFLFDITQDSEIRVCADQLCKRPFEARRQNHRYCSYACAHRTASRRYRNRKAKSPVE